MRIRHCVVLAFGLVASAVATAAAAPARDYVIDVWGTERGLPTSFVNAVAQTPDGYLWIGTQNGLLRFDGLRFVAFDPDNTPALAHARVEHLFVDDGGTLWANTYDGSLTSVRRGTFQLEWRSTGPVDFEAFLASSRGGSPTFVIDRGAVIRRRPQPRADGAWDVYRPPSGALPLFAEDAAGALWIRSVDDRLWKLRDGRFEAVSMAGLIGRHVQCLARDAAGRIWVGTDAEIAVFDGGRFQTMTPHNGEARLDVSILRFTRDGGLWVVANGRARKARDRTWIWTDDAGRGLTGPFRVSVNFLEDRRGGVWLTHFGKGVLHVRPDGRARRLTGADGLPGTRIRSVLEDREGNVWLAIERAGLVRVRDAWFKTLSADGLRDIAVASVAADRDGAMWIGSMGDGLQRYRDGRLDRFPVPDASAGGFVFSVVPDINGRLWLSADREDLFYFDGQRIRPSPVHVHGVKTLLADRDGGLWVGTKTGVARIADGRLHVFGEADGFERRDVRALALGPDGAVWIGSGDGTIYRHRDGRLTRFRPPDAHASHAVWALYIDRDGAVWAGTFRGGLLRLRDGRFDRFTTGRGLPSNIICQILEDQSRQLWVGSHHGIFRVSKASLDAPAPGPLDVVGYSRSDGLPALECTGNYQPAAAAGRDGRLWFATPKGLVSVDPRDAGVARQPPDVILEELLLDQHSVAFATSQTLQPGAEPAAGPGAEPAAGPAAGPRAEARAKPGAGPAAALQIPPGPHRLEFRYTGLSFATPEQVRFRYRVEGLDPEWIDAGAQRAAHYSYVPPGSYRFRVAASHGDGRWSAREASLAFVVLPRLYETRPFQATAGLAALLAVAGTVRFVSTRRLRRRVERLELQRAVERDRDRIARDIHDDLGAGLTQITLLSEIARRESPDQVAGHLGQISDTARELTRTMDEIVWAVNPRHDSLDGLVTYISQFAQEYLTLAGVQCRLDVPAHLPPHPLGADVRHNLFLAVKEVLHNIVKHAHARIVWLRLVDRPTGFGLTIEDDGQGFTPGADAPAGQTDRAAPGRGLGNLHERLAAIGGTCTIASEPGRGTHVTFEVPLP
jgi:ligand-binding sensor domain-containing protein/signal transduction histidine kinase